MKGFSKTQTPNLWRNDASQRFYAVIRTPGKNSAVSKSLKTNKESVAKLRLEEALVKIRELAAVRDVAAEAAAYLKMAQDGAATTNEIDRLRVAIDRLENSARSTSRKVDAGNSAIAPASENTP